MYSLFFDKIQSIINRTKKSIPDVFFYYIIVYLLLSYLLFVFYIPGNDFDSMTSYITRIKLEEFGPLEKTGTLEIQYLFPKFFDYLHAPLLKLGYFITLPNFLLFLTLIFISLAISAPPLHFFILVLIFSSQPLLVGSTSLKNDMTLGIFAFLGWYVIFHFRNKTWFLTVITLILAALVGTKIHGFLLMILLFIPLIYVVIKERLINQLSVVIWFIFAPMFVLISSINTYLSNLKNYGTIMPKLPYLGDSNVPFLKNIYTFTVVNFLQTFDVPAYLSDVYLKTNFLEIGKKIALGSKDADYGIIRPAANINAFGVILLIVLALDIYVLVKPKFSVSIKTLAAIALFYCLGLLTQFYYSNWINRYFLPVYILSILPAAEGLVDIFHKDYFQKRWIKPFFLIYAVLVSLQCLFFTAEKNLIGLRIVDVPTGNSYQTDSVWNHFTDRDALYFHLWGGYLQIYDYFRNNISLDESFLFINKASGNDPPFLYPFVKDRLASNTRIFNARYGGSYESLLGKYKYIMVYRGNIKNPLYEEVLNYNKGEMMIYRLKQS